MNYVPMQCITQIAGPFGPDNIFLLSRDSFDTIKAIKYEQVPLQFASKLITLSID